MKQISKAAIISLFLLIIFISNTSARFIPHSNQGGSLATKLSKSTKQQDNFPSMKEMEIKSCGDKDEESCEKRRMFAEAHLDYIYTQNYQP